MKLCKKCVNFIKVNFKLNWSKLEQTELICKKEVTELHNEKDIYFFCSEFEENDKETTN